MTVAIVLLIACVGLTVFLFRMISLGRISAMSRLTKQRQSVESRFNYLTRRKLELKAELTRKERQLETLINNQQGMRIKTAEEMKINEETEDERVSNLLITMGKVSMEQHEKVLQKKDVLKMDYLATCLTLGYIDAETGKKILKGMATRR